MNADRHLAWFFLWTIALILPLAACLPTQDAPSTPTPTWTVTPTPTPTAASPKSQVTPTPTPTLQSGGPSLTSTPTTNTTDACPQVDVVYQLDYVHRVTQHTPGAQVEHTGGAGAAFYFTVRGDRSIDSNDFENVVPVSIAGKLGDCVLEGQAQLSADINGKCTDGVAALHVAEHWETVATTVTCPGQDPQSTQTTGLFSAPEDRFELRLEDGAVYVLQAETEPLEVYYSWTLHEYGLGIVPLPSD